MCLFLLAFAFGEICFLSSLIPVVDRQCLALVRQCRKKKKLDSSVFSLALLSQYLPSRVSPFNTRRSALRLARCSKVPVIGSLSGESAGLSFSSFDSPLVGSVPSCCWCFTLRCLFSLALRYWLTLLPHSPLFHIQIASKFSTSPHNRHYMPRLEVCFPTVSYLCQYQPT